VKRRGRRIKVSRRREEEKERKVGIWGWPGIYPKSKCSKRRGFDSRVENRKKISRHWIRAKMEWGLGREFAF
jgi:hypothetical protein